MKDAKIGSYLRIWKFPECSTFFDVNIPSISEELLANYLGRIPVTIITEDSIFYCSSTTIRVYFGEKEKNSNKSALEKFVHKPKGNKDCCVQ